MIESKQGREYYRQQAKTLIDSFDLSKQLEKLGLIQAIAESAVRHGHQMRLSDAQAAVFPETISNPVTAKEKIKTIIEKVKSL